MRIGLAAAQLKASLAIQVVNDQGHGGMPKTSITYAISGTHNISSRGFTEKIKIEKLCINDKKTKGRIAIRPYDDIDTPIR